MIIVGAVYKEQCPIQKNIPIWLIVAGAFGCLSSIIRTASNCYSLFAYVYLMKFERFFGGSNFKGFSIILKSN